MRTLRQSVILSLAILLLGCDGKDYDQLAGEYAERNPNEEAEADFRSGDLRIYSAMSVGRYYPGLDADFGADIAAKYGERLIPETTDTIESGSHGNFITVATKFAASYNKRKVALIGNKIDGEGRAEELNTALEFEPGGEKKPKPKSEGRSQ